MRETDAAAWAAAEELIGHLDDADGRARPGQLRALRLGGSAASVDAAGGNGQARSRESLEVAPNLWAGVGLVRHGAGTALVGDPETVAARMREYAEMGIDTFILSGYPHLEEAYRVAELLFPRLAVAR